MLPFFLSNILCALLLFNKYPVTEPIYICYTLFDIPLIGDRSVVRNWNTLVQVISLRTQPFITKFPSFKIDNVSNYKFGKEYKGQHKIWSFEFTVEFPNLFVLENDPVGGFTSDSDLIPMIDYNNNIINLKCLQTNGITCNTYYQLLT